MVLAGSQRIIVTVEWSRRAAFRPSLKKALKAGHELLSEFDLLPLVIADLAVGGVTDAQHLFGLGRDLHSSATPRVEPGLPRTLRHILDEGTKGQLRSVPASSLPPLVNPPRAPLFHEGIARPEGLWPCRFPDILVYAPSYKLKGRWVIRHLTLAERLRLHQLQIGRAHV